MVVIAAFFTLGSSDTPELVDEPVAFDGGRAMDVLREFVTDFPQRTAGSDADDRASIWLFDQFKLLGLESHSQSFTAQVDGEDRAMRNVWAVLPGDTEGTIVILANRDTPPETTQGANNNASGLAALLEIARAFTVTGHEHSLVFLATSGDARGALGSREFVRKYEQRDDIRAVIALNEMATRSRRGIGVDGWSAEPKTAPPWLWLLSQPAAAAQAAEKAVLPGVPSQVLHLAMPTAAGSQAPFVAAGVPAVTVSMLGDAPDPRLDTLDAVSEDSLRRSGSTALAMAMAIDAGQRSDARSGGTIFISDTRTLSGAAVKAILIACFVPFALVTLDLFARCRRLRLPLKPAFVRFGLRLLPWLVALFVTYIANLTGLLPKSPGFSIPFGAEILDDPRYVQVTILFAILLVGVFYALSIERSRARRFWVDPRATTFVCFLALIVVAVILGFINAYSLALIVPAALVWPLARHGSALRSTVVPYLGLLLLPLAMFYYAWRHDVGWKIWWYFIVLLETRTIPMVVMVGFLLLIAATILLSRVMRSEVDWAEAFALGPVRTRVSRPAGERRGDDRERPRRGGLLRGVKWPLLKGRGRADGGTEGGNDARKRRLTLPTRILKRGGARREK